jgi:hypothetical protein
MILSRGAFSPLPVLKRKREAFDDLKRSRAEQSLFLLLFLLESVKEPEYRALVSAQGLVGRVSGGHCFTGRDTVCQISMSDPETASRRGLPRG